MEASRQALTVSELVEAIGSPVAVAEALEALRIAGLVTRAGQCVTVASNPNDEG
jgi:DNA-binding transcriptional ArsR family regulator